MGFEPPLNLSVDSQHTDHCSIVHFWLEKHKTNPLDLKKMTREVLPFEAKTSNTVPFPIRVRNRTRKICPFDTHTTNIRTKLKSNTSTDQNNKDNVRIFGKKTAVDAHNKRLHLPKIYKAKPLVNTYEQAGQFLYSVQKQLLAPQFAYTNKPTASLHKLQAISIAVSQQLA